MAFIWNIAQEAISLYEDWSSISTALQEALFSLDHACLLYTSVVGTHAGPGATGIAYFVRK